MLLKIYTLLLIFIAIDGFSSIEAQNLVSGIVKTHSGEPLSGASVQLIDQNKIELTNESGQFKFELNTEPKNIRFVINYVGCNSLDSICTYQSKNYLFELQCETLMDEMVVKAFYPIKRNSATVLKLQDLKKQPVLLGESDIFKTLQAKPGIDFGTEGSGDMVVRGGSVSENLILLDNLPVFSSSHLFGLLTPFDAEMVDEIQVYKNGFPAKYGGRLSSVVDIKSKKFDAIQPALKVRTGILSTGLYFAGNFGDRTKFILSLRRSLLDGFALLYSATFLGGEEKIIPSFSDAFFKITTKQGENHELSLSTMYSADRFLQGTYLNAVDETYIDEGTTRWRTPMVSLQYNYKKKHTAFDLGIGKSLYNYRANALYQAFQPIDSLEEIFDHQVVNDLNILSANLVQKIKRVALTVGSTFTIKDYNFKTKERSNNYFLKNDSLILKTNNWQNYIALNLENNRTSSSVGVHFLTLPEAGFRTYIEPRLYVDYRFNNQKIYATYSVMHQSDHLIANRSIGNYIKTWIPATEQYLPSKSEELGIGYSFNTNVAAFDIEIYYKRRNDLIHPKEGDLEFITSDNINNLLNDGEGTAYGLEFSANYQLSEKHSINSSYSYSKSVLQFNELNGSKSFNDYFDRPHTFKLLHNWKLNKKWEMNNQFTFLSGTPFTFINNVYPNALFSSEDIGISGGSLPQNAVFYFDNLNNKRLPFHHRLDINVTKKAKFKKFPASLGFGVYNVYANINPMFVELEKEFEQRSVVTGTPSYVSTTGLKYNVISYFNFIPYINYTINFR